VCISGNQIQPAAVGTGPYSRSAGTPHPADGREQQAEHSLGCSEQQTGGFGSLTDISLASAGGPALNSAPSFSSGCER